MVVYRVPGIRLSLSPQHWDYKHMSHAVLFIWVLGIERSLASTLVNEAVSAAPLQLFMHFFKKKKKKYFSL